jgi:hypothetical protein
MASQMPDGSIHYRRLPTNTANVNRYLSTERVISTRLLLDYLAGFSKFSQNTRRITRRWHGVYAQTFLTLPALRVRTRHQLSAIVTGA